MCKKFYLLICILISHKYYSQSLEEFPLNDLSAFKSQAGNWQIVESVFMDKNIDVYKNGNGHIKTKPGKGILINLNDASKKDALITNWNHGDIDIELEFMMPKGSNSGIYLQGRYELQLFDSWGVKHPKFSDLGGIYRNWENTPGNIYMGKAPLYNAAKAPGLWQTMFISFRAPRFDASGKKIANAKFNIVKINGLTIHENIEIPLPTGGPISKEEVAEGPLMIQGDHGAVAFRKIKLRKIENKKIVLENLNYKYWKGPYEHEDEYKSKPADKSGSCKEGLTWEVSEVKDFFALHFTGDLITPLTENYYINPIFNGNFAMYIDGIEVFKNRKAWDWDRFEPKAIPLTAGKHKVDIYYSRKDAWLDPNLALFIEGDHCHKQELHAFSSYKVRKTIAPVKVKVKETPVILRAFLDFNKDNKLRRTHTIGVGDPTQINYIFDNELGVISAIWKGEFVDATPMWIDRGDGSFRPASDAIYLDNTYQLDFGNEPVKSNDEMLTKSYFRSKGYKINEDTNTPIFHYTINGVNITDQLYPDAISGSLIRELKFDKVPQNARFRLAHGENIENIGEQRYLIDGLYYLETDAKVYVKNNGNKKELVSDINSDKIRYSLIW